MLRVDLRLGLVIALLVDHAGSALVAEDILLRRRHGSLQRERAAGLARQRLRLVGTLRALLLRAIARLLQIAALRVEALAYDLRGGKLRLDSLWVNILKPGAGHSGHIHPHSVISGTIYVQTPPGASALKLEDPRLPLMMAAPPRRPDAPEGAQAFVYLQPSPGTIYLWESWLRHEVPPNQAKTPRVSVSFNYGWR